MDMTRFFKLPAVMLFALLAAGCAKFDEQAPPAREKPSEGRLVTAGIKLTAAAELDGQGCEISITRAPNDYTDAEENAIRNVWIFQFGEPATAGSDDSRILLRSCYIDEDDISGAVGGEIPVDLIESGAKKNLLVFIANVNHSGYGWNMTPGQHTYADLKSRSYLLRTDTEDLFIFGGEWRNIIMSGAAEVKVAEGLVIDSDTDDPAQNAGITLTPSLAKIQLELTLGNPDYMVLSVKLCAMPDRIMFTDALNSRTALEPAGFSPSLIDLPIAEDLVNGIVADGQTETLVWYMPRNTRGSNPVITSAADKNRYAPTWATYIEIMAKHVTDGTGVLYRIYPGADITDFNIIPNHRYVIKQTIAGNGGADITDSRIEQFGNVRFDGNNNCFILNPPTSEGMGARTFEIPVTQVNRYWMPNQQSYPGYGGLQNGAILTNTRWRVDLLWQDDNIVRATADIPSRIWISKAEGKGPDDHFSITVPYGAVEGNFVMAIRCYDPDSSPYEDMQLLKDEVQWSWHFWVTGYNPDRLRLIAFQSDRFAYVVPGGQVHRYGGAAWGYDTAGATVNNNWNNYAYNPSSTGAYAKAFIMDRNVGKLNSAYTSYNAKGSLTYQFGRKDPFPGLIGAGNYPLYNINGDAISATAATGFMAQRWNSYANGNVIPDTGTVADAVKNPMKFYAAPNRWASNVDGYNNVAGGIGYIWQDPMIEVSGQSSQVRSYAGKSIYDPCPPGWKLPVPAVWEDFRQNKPSGAWTVNTGSVIPNRDLPIYVDGMTYWPNIEIGGEYPVERDIFYPVTYYRNSSSNGAVYTYADYGHFWTAVPYSSYNGYSMRLHENSLLNPTNMYRSHGLSVRCVSMEE